MWMSDVPCRLLSFFCEKLILWSIGEDFCASMGLLRNLLYMIMCLYLHTISQRKILLH